MKNSVSAHIGLALLRIIPSLMMLSHGIPKLQKLIAGDFKFANPLGIGEAPSLFLTVLGEVAAPLLLILGFKTKLAAVPALITMLVAAFVVHGADPFSTKELALLYAAFFLVILFTGPGKFSIDRK